MMAMEKIYVQSVQVHPNSLFKRRSAGILQMDVLILFVRHLDSKTKWGEINYSTGNIMFTLLI